MCPLVNDRCSVESIRYGAEVVREWFLTRAAILRPSLGQLGISTERCLRSCIHKECAAHAHSIHFEFGLSPRRQQEESTPPNSWMQRIIHAMSEDLSPQFRFEPRVRVPRMLVPIKVHRGLKAVKSPAEDRTRWVTHRTSPFSSHSNGEKQDDPPGGQHRGQRSGAR